MPGLCGGSTWRGEAGASADHESRDQRADAGGGVDHDATGEIDDARGRGPAATPNPMCNRQIDDNEPPHREQQDEREAHAFRERADYERRRDDGEGHLKQHEHRLR